uniref:Rap-GAP domain-containing protein n=1 Tax=Steinernema glaseri TaxID=37863 RepID=A0A1I8AB63_9BILA
MTINLPCGRKRLNHLRDCHSLSWSNGAVSRGTGCKPNGMVISHFLLVGLLKLLTTSFEWDISSIDDESIERDSDTGLESMSSGDHRLSCHTIGTGELLHELKSDVEQLKTEKLDLLHKNAACKQDIKQLKQRQSLLESDLDKAHDEISRLKELLNKSA